MELEESLHTTLFVRGKRGQHLSLTEEGYFLRRTAEEILSLADRTQAAFLSPEELVAGDVYICAGETETFRLLARAAVNLQHRSPLIRVHLSSGDRDNVTEQLDEGLVDFGLIIGELDATKYDYLSLQNPDSWVILMRRTDPLAAKEKIRPEDLHDSPLIISRQPSSHSRVLKWLGKVESEVNIVTYYSLVYNASILADEGLGCVFTLDGLINTTCNSTLCTRPLDPPLQIPNYLVWKKQRSFTRAAAFLAELKTQIKEKADLFQFPEYEEFVSHSLHPSCLISGTFSTWDVPVFLLPEGNRSKTSCLMSIASDTN